MWERIRAHRYYYKALYQLLTSLVGGTGFRSKDMNPRSKNNYFYVPKIHEPISLFFLTGLILYKHYFSLGNMRFVRRQVTPRSCHQCYKLNYYQLDETINVAASPESQDFLDIVRRNLTDG